MINFYIWTILGITTAVLLIVFWKKRNAVWGGFTLGTIMAFIIAFFLISKGGNFDWYIIGKSAVIGTLLGFVAELLGKVADYIKKNL